MVTAAAARSSAPETGAPARVLVITVFPPMKAPEADHALHLCEHLADAGRDVHVLTTQSSAASRHRNLTVHPVMRDWSWSDLPRLAGCLRRVAPDAVLLNYTGWIYNDHPMVTFAPTVAKRLLPDVVFTTLLSNANGAFHARSRRRWQAIRDVAQVLAGNRQVDFAHGTLLRDSDSLIVLSDLHRAELAKRFEGIYDKSILVPPPPIMPLSSLSDAQARQKGRQALKATPDELLIVFFGYIYWSKGIEYLLEAFHMVLQKRSGLRLALVGGLTDSEAESLSYAAELRARIERLGIEDRVVWSGNYDWDSDIASVYLRAADICVLPFVEGVYLNNSSFAAVATHGLPTITTAGEFIEEPFVDGRNMLLCPPKDSQALAAALEKLVDDADLRQRLRANIRELARDCFSWETATKQTIGALARKRSGTV